MLILSPGFAFANQEAYKIIYQDPVGFNIDIYMGENVVERREIGRASCRERV